jgi:very-short-patch-repair endonuclease
VRLTPTNPTTDAGGPPTCPERLIVELDGLAFHAPARAFERDRVRDRALSVAGWRVVRVTWRQLRDDPVALAGDLRRLLAVTARAG